MNPPVPSECASAGGEVFLAIARGDAAVAAPCGGAVLAEARRLAKFHGVMPLFSRYILDHPSMEWSTAMRDEAQKFRDFVLFRNVQLMALLGEIQKTLEGNGMPWISIKGPVFTEQYAGDSTLRASGDLDVLVRPQDALKADELFHGMGIACRKPIRPHTSWLGVHQNEHSYYSASPRYLIEVHWNLAGDCYEIVDSDTAFRRSRVAKVEAGAFPVLSPEDTLLFAAMHSLGHRWSHFYHVKNLDWILRETRPGPGGKRVARALDWDYVLCAAAQTRKTRSLLLGLSLVRESLGAELPEPVNHLIDSDPALPALRARVADNFRGAGPARSSWQTLLFKWRALESGRDRVGLFLRALVTRMIWRR